MSRNHETQLCINWLLNDEKELEEIRYVIEDLHEEEAVEAIKDYIESMIPNEPCLFTDLLESAIEEIDFGEVYNAIEG